MSGICGIINFDGRPVERDLLERMARAAACRGKDGIRYWIRGQVGLVHLALHTTPESKLENQPLVQKHNGLVLVADARIDDRQALISRIRAKNVFITQRPTDAALILASYMAWGENCPEQLTGDFAFVVWDSNRHQVFAARDRSGCRCLYYRRTGNSIRFATQASQLIADPDYKPALNRRLVARDLVFPGFSGQHQSYYLGIDKLGVAEKIQSGPDHFSCKKYWRLSADRRIIYQDSREYGEHFRELFGQCVGDRLRCEGSTGIFLSGGLDSSCVAAVAGDKISRNASTVTSDLKCVNWTYGEHHVANEQPFAQAVASKWHLDFETMSMVDFPPLYDYPWRPPHVDEPYHSPISCFFNATLDKSAKSHHSPKVWMTGFYGDMLVGGQNPFYYSDLLAKAKWFEVARQIRRQKQAYQLSWKQALLFSILIRL